MDIKDIDFDHVNDNVPRYGENFDYGGEDSVWCVYVHINKINDKKYIGITSNIKDRWTATGKRYKRCKAFYKAIQKYGWDGFKHIVLMTGLTQSEASIAEKILIKKYNTLVQNGHGYNIVEGGYDQRILHGENSPVSKPIHQYDLNGVYIQSFDCISDAVRLLNGNIHKDIDNGFKSIRNALNRKNHYCYGYLWSLELLDSLEPFNKYNNNRIHNNYGSIIQTDFDGNFIKKYDSVHYISDSVEKRTEIIRCCKGYKNRLTCDNSLWFFEEDYIPEIIYRKVNQVNSKKYKNLCNKKSIKMFDKNGKYIKTFETAKEAERQTGVNASNISACLTGRTKTAGGYIWQYYDNYKIAKLNNKTNKILKIYDDYRQIEKDMNLKDCSGIRQCIIGKNKTSNGFTWRYIDANNNIIEPNF